MTLVKDTGVAPDLRDVINGIMKGMSKAAVLVATPATLGNSAAAVNAAIGGAAAKFVRDVQVKITNADGTLAEWFDGTFTVAVSKSSTSGVIAFESGWTTTMTFVNGRASTRMKYTGTWASGDTATFTITGGTLLGFTVSNKTSVDTLVA